MRTSSFCGPLRVPDHRGTLYDSKDSDHYFRSFYARRILRIFPLYYGFLIFWMIVIPVFRRDVFDLNSDNQIFYWLYLQNWRFSAPASLDGQILAITWSLAIEEQFYLAWPLVVSLLRRRQLMMLCLTLVVTSLVVRVALTVLGAHQITVYMPTPARMDGLAVGAFIALALRSPGGLALRPWAGPVALGAILAFVGMAFWAWWI